MDEHTTPLNASTNTPSVQQKGMKRRTRSDDDGGVTHIVTFDGDDRSGYDKIIVRHQPDDPQKMTVHAYEGDDITYQNAFGVREFQFDPISILGRGETKKLLGVSEIKTSKETDLPSQRVPNEVQVVFNNITMAVVPQGEWWL